MSDKTTLEAFFEDSNKTKIALLESKIDSLTKAEREAHNRAIDEAAKLIWALRNEPHVSVAEVNDEIQKLRK